jgi:L-ascorbate metabolism protein UlaG (beta-lactamase superfamily)
LSSLPPLDAVVLSHDHYDHLDASTVRELGRMGVPFVTALGVGEHLESYGVAPEKITELDWWERTEVRAGGLTITATPSQHFSGRGVADRNATLWASMAIEGPHHKVFFSGDTGLTPEYDDIRKHFGRFDLVLLEVGAFHPAWGDIHLGPDNALTALERLGGGTLLPVHWGTFNLAIHAWDEPAETLLVQAPRRGAHLVMPMLGEAVEPTRSEAVTPWWRAAMAPSNRHGETRDTPTLPEGSTGDDPVPWPVD